MTDKIAAPQIMANRPSAPQELYRKLEKESREKLPLAQDQVNIDGSLTKGVYGKLAGVEVGSPYQLLKQLVIKTLEDQGIASKITTDTGEIDLGSLTPEAAQELISEDGYFGVEKTSQRIVDFAINAFGADPTKLTQIKDAIEKGFQDAAAVFGGQLPEISHQTYAAVMEKLDAFAEKSAEKQQ